MIPKSGNLKEVHNWRPIALLDIFYKLFARLVYDRLYPVLNNAQCSVQHAYRHSYSIEDPLHVFEMMTSKCNEYDIEFWAASIDLRKAFDRLKHDCIFKALRFQNVPEEYIVLLKRLYAGQTGQIRKSLIFYI